MAAETDTDTDPGALISEKVAGGILPKVLTTFDMVAIFVAIVLFITNAAIIQSAGPAAFGWWIIGFVVFLVPCAIATGQLGAMFPGEGSIYLWTHKAFGPFWGPVPGAPDRPPGGVLGVLDHRRAGLVRGDHRHSVGLVSSADRQ